MQSLDVGIIGAGTAGSAAAVFLVRAAIEPARANGRAASALRSHSRREELDVGARDSQHAVAYSGDHLQRSQLSKPTIGEDVEIRGPLPWSAENVRSRRLRVIR